MAPSILLDRLPPRIRVFHFSQCFSPRSWGILTHCRPGAQTLFTACPAHINPWLPTMKSNHATQQPVDWILSHQTQNASRANDGAALRPLLRMQVASQSLTWALAQSCISGALKERRHDAAIAWIAE